MSIASDNANTSLAKVGDTVTISMTSSEALIGAPTVTIDGNAADTVIATGLNSYEATRLMQAGDSAGVVGFSIDFTDAVGNAGTQVTATTDSSSVTFDEGSPTLSAVSIASDNANSSLAKVGDTVTISMTSSEALIGAPTVTIDGNPADTVIATGLNSYEATRLMQAGDSAGVVVFSIDFTDAVGNAGTQVTSTTDSSSVSFDEGSPTLSAVSIASDNANSSLAKVGDTVTLSLTSSEALIGAPTVTIDGNPADTVIATGLNSYEATRLMQAGDSAGVVVFSIDFTDAVGNSGTQVTSTTDSSSVSFDEGSPTLSAVSIASDNANSSLAKVGDTVTISMTSSEALLGDSHRDHRWQPRRHCDRYRAQQLRSDSADAGGRQRRGGCLQHRLHRCGGQCGHPGDIHHRQLQCELR